MPQSFWVWNDGGLIPPLAPAKIDSYTWALAPPPQQSVAAAGGWLGGDRLGSPCALQKEHAYMNHNDLTLTALPSWLPTRCQASS